MTTHSTLLRKALEVPLAYAADLLLPKARILELYLNVVEWGPGVFGAEAAAQYHYGISAASLTRYQSAALAACLPNPRDRSPHQMTRYTHQILARMVQHGW
jgi:monofunctional biosynthetic peptidoglycan transglycosylase